jgi:ribosomal protein S18 acetylase RimI-like enzyme
VFAQGENNVSKSVSKYSKDKLRSAAMHPLDNVIWKALTTRQANFAESFLDARRFFRDVTALGAFHEPTDRGYESLAGLVGTGGTVALFLEKPYEPRPGWNLIADAPLLQMVCANGSAPIPSGFVSSILELTPADSPEMVELAALTKPGPFGIRTRELGTYLGIRHEGKLVAMTGERLKVPGYTEVSAVCTHPKHTGKGYAGTLMMEVMRRIRERGELPFLHVRQDNVRAIELYKRLGIAERTVLYLAVITKT